MLQPILQRQAFDPAKFAGVVGNQDAPRGQRCSGARNVIIHNFPMLFYKRYFRKPSGCSWSYFLPAARSSKFANQLSLFCILSLH